MGETGLQGPQGLQGIQGPEGPQGPAGADGGAGGKLEHVVNLGGFVEITAFHPNFTPVMTVTIPPGPYLVTARFDVQLNDVILGANPPDAICRLSGNDFFVVNTSVRAPNVYGVIGAHLSDVYANATLTTLAGDVGDPAAEKTITLECAKVGDTDGDVIVRDSEIVFMEGSSATLSAYKP